MKTKRLLFQAAFTALILLLPAVKAKADPLVFLTTPDVFGPAGRSVTVYGIIGNFGEDPIVVNSPFVSAEGDVFGFLTDVTPFYENPGFDPSDEVGGYFLLPGQDTGVIPLFSVDIDFQAFQGFPFFGFFYVTDSQDVFSNLQFFTVTATEPIPEPATMVLLGTGLAGGWATLKRRRRKAAAE